MTHPAVAFLRHLLWAFRRGRGARHMLGVPPHFAATALRLAMEARRARGKLLAIALVEHMGDIAAAEPIARHARATHPDARVIWIARAPFAELAASFPAVDAVLVVRCLTEWILLRRLGLIDIVWDLHINGRICPHCCVPLEKTAAHALPVLANYFDYGSLLDAQCQAAGLPRLAEGPRLAPPPAAARAVDALALPDRFVVVHGAANEARRDWPAEKWRALLARLSVADPDLTVVEVGLRPVAIPAGAPGRRSLCGELSVLETAEVIRRAALFVGIDSGPAHLANAVGTPGVLLLGRYGGFPKYMPFSGGYAGGARATVLRAEGIAAELTVDQVRAAIVARIGEVLPARIA